MQPAVIGGAEMILVVEDEEALGELTKDVLKELGYRVLLARDGREAIELYEAEGEQIDLVMLDVVMPRLSGREAYERLMSLDGGVPVIFMTGYSAGMAQDRFLEDVGAALLQKPYSVETLGLKVCEVLDVRRTVAHRKENVPQLA